MEAQTGAHALRGCGQSTCTDKDSRMVLGNPSRECERHVDEIRVRLDCTRVPRDTGNPVGKQEGPPSKAKYSQ